MIKTFFLTAKTQYLCDWNWFNWDGYGH